MDRFLLVSIWLSIASSLAAADAKVTSSKQPSPTQVILVVVEDQAITPVTARFIRRALEEAVAAEATCVIIQLDTPGGTLDATRQIVKDVLASRVPVVVYVAPDGARAASAGFFITMASHVAAMAPVTHLGAAHPVQVGGLPISPPNQTRQKASKTGKQGKGEERSNGDSVMEDKVVNDTLAWARSLARLRHRDVKWAEEAVAHSSTLTASEALQRKVVEIVAKDLDDLLKQLDGRTVETPHGSVRLSTQGASVRTVSMWWGEKFLATLANPTLAFLLLMFGFYGILFEFYSPGWGVSGTLGVICLVLGFFALSVLPVSYAGLALIALALGLFTAEAFVPSFGALTLGGIVCLILGGLMLVDSPSGFMRVSLGVIVPVAAGTGLIAFFLIGSVIKAYRGRVQTGGEELLGTEALVDAEFKTEPNTDGHVGVVTVHGERWRAVSPVHFSRGARVEIAAREGLTLVVRPAVTREAK